MSDRFKRAPDERGPTPSGARFRKVARDHGHGLPDVSVSSSYREVEASLEDERQAEKFLEQYAATRTSSLKDPEDSTARAERSGRTLISLDS
jgi:hypothetical protein